MCIRDRASYRPAPGSIPESPGVYRFRDERGRVIYVGKAKSLRSRLSSYFADFVSLHPRTQTMLTSAARVDWTVVGTEVEALQLEYSWIKEFDPRFNVRYRDDKSYPYLAVTVGEDYPRVMVMRGARRRGVRYFGPYSHAWAIRDTVDTLLRVFPVRTCSAGVFERAARLRDDIQALQHALEKQAVVLADGTDCDVIALAEDQLEAAVQVFYVRGGRVRGQRGWVVDKVEAVTTGELVEQFLGQVYGDDAVAADRPVGRSPGSRRGGPGHGGKGG